MSKHIDALREFVADGNDGTLGTYAMHGSQRIGGLASELLTEIDTLTQERDTLASRWAAVVEHQRIMLGFAMLSDDEDVCQTMAHANQNYSAMEAERDAARAALVSAAAGPTVTCEGCGFRYGAEHTTTEPDGGYRCPLCELACVEKERDALYQDAARLDYVERQGNQRQCWFQSDMMPPRSVAAAQTGWTHRWFFYGQGLTCNGVYRGTLRAAIDVQMEAESVDALPGDGAGAR